MFLSLHLNYFFNKISSEMKHPVRNHYRHVAAATLKSIYLNTLQH